jgi:hypothetical protein
MFWLRWTLQMCCCSLFKVPLYHSWCALKSRQGILQQWYTVSYSTMAKVCWKLWRMWKNSLIIAKDVWIIHLSLTLIAVTLSEKNGSITFVPLLISHVCASTCVFFVSKLEPMLLISPHSVPRPEFEGSVNYQSLPPHQSSSAYAFQIAVIYVNTRYQNSCLFFRIIPL